MALGLKVTDHLAGTRQITVQTAGTLTFLSRNEGFDRQEIQEMSKTENISRRMEHPPLLFTVLKGSVPLCLPLIAVLNCCFSFIL